ncbi:Dioxygenase lolE1 [Fulvia fulva]|uniref:Dioxygenase lolE1 n=1 Tax=Passalora fulva TaxID=5499 RepID=A0A9Q8LCE5_PASFU|nr:Dioxygenase lolE1 [Fulvia fulva]KAK4629531.1 Dioxygenase lolE1 [Fulvia fulva]KAK4630495.1 Dioxygenase lolE1 [Fulvia fulva]UJO14809.1 Dioxygenase lolE1 [Fulvia fulva]WPV12437.1 Dioxygenase lolE1 [Fulvia fulva]WPV27591.1 Dioxygenase lolE1 [Fulvia fulva]
MQWASPQLSENRPTDRQEPCPITTTTTAMTNLILTDEQIAHFDTQGYLILPCQSHNLVSPPLLQKWTNEVRNLPREHGKWMPYDELTASGERQLMRTDNFVDYHPSFSSLLHGPALASILKQLTRSDMLLFKDIINCNRYTATSFISDKLPNGNDFTPTSTPQPTTT